MTKTFPTFIDGLKELLEVDSIEQSVEHNRGVFAPKHLKNIRICESDNFVYAVDKSVTEESYVWPIFSGLTEYYVAIGEEYGITIEDVVINLLYRNCCDGSLLKVVITREGCLPERFDLFSNGLNYETANGLGFGWKRNEKDEYEVYVAHPDFKDEEFVVADSTLYKKMKELGFVVSESEF